MEIPAEVEAHLHLFCVSSIHCGEGFAVIRALEHGDGECHGEIVQFQSCQVGSGRCSGECASRAWDRSGGTYAKEEEAQGCGLQ